MKSMIVIALALTSVASFSATNNTKACANLKGAELKSCEAKNVKTSTVVETKAVVSAPAAVVAKDAKKDAPVVTAKNVKAAAATTTTTTTPATKK
jgi:hypothetical protein